MALRFAALVVMRHAALRRLTPRVYDCANIESSMSAARVRNDEIEQLMSRAAQGTGGAFVNLVAYRTEYLQNKGRMAAMKKAAAEKKCAIDSEYSSRRSVY